MDFDRGSADELVESAEGDDNDLPAWARPPEWIQVRWNVEEWKRRGEETYERGIVPAELSGTASTIARAFRETGK